MYCEAVAWVHAHWIVLHALVRSDWWQADPPTSNPGRSITNSGAIRKAVEATISNPAPQCPRVTHPAACLCQHHPQPLSWRFRPPTDQGLPTVGWDKVVGKPSTGAHKPRSAWLVRTLPKIQAFYYLLDSIALRCQQAVFSVVLRNGRDVLQSIEGRSHADCPRCAPAYRSVRQAR
jgi:hypothetical protein